MSTPMPSLAALVRAETTKLVLRTSARLGLAMVAFLAVAVPLGLLLVQAQFELDPEAVAELIKLPEDHMIGFMVAIGKATEPAQARGGQLALEEVVFENSF